MNTYLWVCVIFFYKFNIALYIHWKCCVDIIFSDWTAQYLILDPNIFNYSITYDI